MCLFDVGFVLKLCCPALKKPHLGNKGRDEDATACSNHWLIFWVSFSLAATRFPPEELWGPALLVVTLVKCDIGLIKYTEILLYPESWCIMRQWLGTLYVNCKKTTYCCHLQSPFKCFFLWHVHTVLPVPLSYCTASCRRKETGIKIAFTSSKMCAFWATPENLDIDWLGVSI